MPATRSRAAAHVCAVLLARLRHCRPELNVYRGEEAQHVVMLPAVYHDPATLRPNHRRDELHHKLWGRLCRRQLLAAAAAAAAQLPPATGARRRLRRRLAATYSSCCIGEALHCRPQAC